MDSTRPAEATRRLELLQRLGLFNTDGDPAFDAVTRIAAAMTGPGSAMLTVCGADRQWVQSRAGVVSLELALEEVNSLCAAQRPALLEISDAAQHPRFSSHSLVAGPPRIRFYAARAVAFDGLVIGAVCVFDTAPQTLSTQQRGVLADLSTTVEHLLQRRHQQFCLAQERGRAATLASLLHEVQLMLREAQSVANLGDWEIEVSSGAIKWSAGMYKIFSRSQAEGPVTAGQITKWVHPDDRVAFETFLRQALMRAQPAQHEYRLAQPSCPTRWMRVVSEPVYNSSGQLLRLRGTLQDISERKEVERLVYESAERDRLLWETTTDVVLIVDEKSDIQFCNPAVHALLGYEVAELIGRPLELLQPESLREAHRKGFARYLKTNERRLDWRAVQTVALHRDGHELPVEISFSDMQIGGRRVFGAFMRDITVRQQQQVALRQSEERYRRIVQTAEEGIWVIDANNVTTFVNPKMSQMLGYTEAEMIGRTLFEFMDQDAQLIALAHVHRRRQAISEQHDFRLRCKDGRIVWTAMSTSAVFDEQGHYAGALSMVTDVTKRRHAEDALRQSEARFRSLTALSSDWYWEMDDQWRLSQIVGGQASDASSALRGSLGAAPWGLGAGAMDPAEWARHQSQLESHEPFRDFEIRGYDAKGALQIVTVSGEPMFDDEGRFTGYRGVGRDVTEQRRGEHARQILEAQLREAQKMEAIGVLAGGIAHDFNNVLAAILGNAEMAREDLAPDHPSAKSLEHIRTAGIRARGLVQQILAFARRQPRELSNCELHPLLEECTGLLRATLPAGVQLELQMPASPMHVMADSTQLQQVLMNLCTNAWHALEGHAGRIELRLTAVKLDAAGAKSVAAGLPAGRYACLGVTDNGSGMTAQTRARIFEPFFTTKRVGEGTGLGLSVVHGIVAAHGGAIAVDSVLGEGSTFRIYLPLVDEAPAAKRQRADVTSVPRGRGERVLYIDDDEVIVLMVERMLERLGYNVVCMRDPVAAVAAVHVHPRAFDIVITDLNMPELSGLDVAVELAQIRPDLPVVISSGNIPEQLQRDARAAGVRALVHKQYTLEELGGAIHRALSGIDPTMRESSQSVGVKR